MTSITGWSRLEPRPSTNDIRDSLAAEIRDPLWMLTRQWQLGEFQGEDAASPASVALKTRTAIDGTWGPRNERPSRPLLCADGDGPVLPAAPLERVVMEEFADGEDVSLAAELGQLFEALLVERLGADAAGEVLPWVRRKYPLGSPSQGRELDESSRRFIEFCVGRGTDGVQLARAGMAGTFGARLHPLSAALDEVMGLFLDEVLSLHGNLAGGNPDAWVPECLRYDASLALGEDASASETRLRLHPGGQGELDWYDFDVVEGGDRVPDPEPTTRTMLPAHVRFRGMPNARWWDFESSRSDFGDVRVDRRDLGRLAVMDFMIVHGNDWFMVPMDMHVGTVCEVASLTVHDVFGGVTRIPPVHEVVPEWSMFSTSRIDPDRPERPVAPFFHLPASASMSLQTGPVLEEVRFLRDEMANMAWALEHTAQNAIGEPVPFRERTDEITRRTVVPVPAAREEGAPAYTYRLQTEVPRYWYPLVPWPFGDPARGQIELRLGTMEGSDGALQAPDGRLLRDLVPTSGGMSSGALRLKEEEVPRVGVAVRRRVQVSRWLDGSVHVWTSRIRETGTGEGSSGLRYDLLDARR